VAAGRAISWYHQRLWEFRTQQGWQFPAEWPVPGETASWFPAGMASSQGNGQSFLSVFEKIASQNWPFPVPKNNWFLRSKTDFKIEQLFTGISVNAFRIVLDTKTNVSRQWFIIKFRFSKIKLISIQISDTKVQIHLDLPLKNGKTMNLRRRSLSNFMFTEKLAKSTNLVKVRKHFGKTKIW